MKVLSLFDGMACARLALERAGIPVEAYYASEIDNKAVYVTSTKWPDIIHLGSVTGVSAKDLPVIDLIVGGSPCQGFSFAGKGLNFNDPRSALFFEYVRILKEVRQANPDVLFLLENVRMKKVHEDVISNLLGMQPININSALLSAQNRERLYWTNIGIAQRGLFSDAYCTIPQPKDKGIILGDILESVVAEKYFLKEKAMTRIQRKGYSQPKVNPDKTGTINSKNNSGQLSVDSRTTLIISDRGKSGAYIMTENKTGALSAHDGCSHDHFVLVDIKGKPKNNQDKSSCFTAGGHSGGYHSDMDLVVHGRDPEIIQTARGNNKGGARALNGKVPSIGASSWEHNNHLKIPQAERIAPALNSQLSIGGNLIEVKDCGNYIEWDGGGFDQDNRAYYPDCKSGTIDIKSNRQKILLHSRIRRLTPIEVCRLQTVPDEYFLWPEGKELTTKWDMLLEGKERKALVSDSSIYRMIGNGWTVDVIAHILSFIQIAKAKAA